MKNKVFISLSYNHKDRLSKVLTSIVSAVKNSGLTPLIFSNEYKLDGNNYQKMMKDALCEISDSFCIIAELSHQAIGVGIELGYAKAKNKKIIYIREKNRKISTTTKGIADFTIEYKSEKDLNRQLTLTLQQLQIDK